MRNLDTTSYDPAPEPLADGLRLVSTSPDTPIGQAAERFAYRIYLDAGYCEPSPREHVEELERWRASSTLHVVVDDNDSVIGTIRSIVGKFDDLPAAKFATHNPAGDSTVVEVSSVAVEMSHRGLGVASELHAAAFQAGVRATARGWCFVVEQWLIDYLGDRYAFPTVPLGSNHWYMGGDIASVYVGVPELMAVFPTQRPSAYRRAIATMTADELEQFGLPVV